MKKTFLFLGVLSLAALSFKDVKASLLPGGKMTATPTAPIVSSCRAGFQRWVISWNGGLNNPLAINAKGYNLALCLKTTPETSTVPASVTVSRITGSYITNDPINTSGLIPLSGLDNHLDGHSFTTLDAKARSAASGFSVLPVVVMTISGQGGYYYYSTFSGRYSSDKLDTIVGAWSDIDGATGNFNLRLCAEGLCP